MGGWFKKASKHPIRSIKMAPKGKFAFEMTIGLGLEIGNIACQACISNLNIIFCLTLCSSLTYLSSKSV